MEKLTKKEEEIMQIVWQLERCTVSDILDVIERNEGKRPPHSSIATIVQILEKDRKFLDFKAFGKTYEYFPIISKEAYGRRSLSKLVSDYFEGSAQNLVSFLVKEEKMDADELKKLLDKLDNNG
jgi:BlaI family transcriptional regulator, penicillinase repressor